MKIGFDAKRIFHNNTGLGNYGRDILRILHEYTPINEFILYNTKKPKAYKIPKYQKINIQYPEKWLWKLFPSLWRLTGVKHQIKKDKLNIYHGLSGEIPKGISKKNTITIVTIHDLIFLSHPHYYSFFDRLIYKSKFKYAAKNAHKIIAISEQTKRDIIKYFDIKTDDIKVIYQGCNTAFKKEYSKEAQNKVKDKYQLPEKYILNVGTLQERKNALSIVKAIKDTNIQLVLIGGEKKYAKSIHAYIKNNQLENQIYFLKNVEVKELAIIYQLASIFCYPSICEGFGIPIIEAMYSKTPVITSTGNCFSEAGGPNSIYVSALDSLALKKEILFLYKNPDACNEIAKKSYEYVQRFNDENVAKNIFELYNSVSNE
ncbi:glycosyltransferase family 1 protein [uncultured Maribacter sp.]|uniref:glycosyltransferase family 4 protein n=1 Tax=uncultured Maribacter sp. TaxID=431308 RepID=UPI00260B3857|nr:glycosyltransferase family 1 protein [uncultured Maribacter sp.]